MYKISTRGQYALLIMEDLASNTDDKYVPLKLLSHRRNLSVKYLEQILIHLSKAGLVTGSRGISGGYKLSKDANDYTVGEILRVMEGDLSPQGTFETNTIISEGNKKFWKNFESKINDYVDSVTLDKLAKTTSEFVGYEYCI